MKLTIITEREAGGRWVGRILEMPRIKEYGRTEKKAVAKIVALALRKIATQIEIENREAESIELVL